MRTSIPRQSGSADPAALDDVGRTVRTMAIVVATIACSISFLVAAVAEAEPRNSEPAATPAAAVAPALAQASNR